MVLRKNIIYLSSTCLILCASTSMQAYAQQQQDYVGVNGTSTGTGSNKDGSGAVGAFTIAIGDSAGAQDFGVALGHSAIAHAINGTAIGYEAETTGGGATAVGFNTKAVGQHSAAFGESAESTGDFSVAVGNLAHTIGMFSTALGANATTDMDSSIAIGYRSKTENALAIAVGFQANSKGTSSVVFGTSASVDGNKSTAIGSNSKITAASALALGSGATVTDDNSVALGADSKTAATVSTASHTINGTSYNFAGATAQGTVSIGDATKERTLTNLAAGRLSATSTDAVNGSQLFNTITAVDGLGTQLTALGNSAVSFLGGTSSIDAATMVVTAGLKVGATNFTNVQDALTALNTTATTGWSLIANGGTPQAIATGDMLEIDEGTNIKVTQNGKKLTFATQDDLTAKSLTLDSGQVFDSQGLNLNNTKAINVLAGAISATSKDAINGAQIFGISSGLAAHFGGNATVNVDGTINGPVYQVQGQGYNTVFDAFNAVDSSINDINNTINNLNVGTVKYFHTNSIKNDSVATGANSTAIGPESKSIGVSSIAIGDGANSSGDKSIAIGEGAIAHNANSVALGNGATTADVVVTTGTTINGTHYDFAGSAPVGTVSVGNANETRTITNVAAGQVNASSTDAVNGSQLHATNTAIENITTNIGQLDALSVKYDADAHGGKSNKITLLGGDPNVPVVISNLGAGVADNDAVNLGQLKNSINDVNINIDNKFNESVEIAKTYTNTVTQNILNESNNYTDNKFDQLQGQIGDVTKEARQAAAIGLAAASLRFDDRPGKVSVAMGGGHWRGQNALALGLGYTSESSSTRVNVSSAYSGGNWGVGGGVSFTFN